MDKEIKIVLPEEQFKGAPATDLNEKVVFEADRRDLVENERNIRVDLIEQFNKERQECEKYRIFGKVTPIFVNAYQGTTKYPPLLNSLYLTQSPLISNTNGYAGYPPYNEFAFIRRDVTRDRTNPDGTLTEVIGNKHIEVYPYNAHEFNWNMYMTYVNDKVESRVIRWSESETNMLTFNITDGLPVKVSYDQQQRLAICECPVEHGLSDKDHVLIGGKVFKVDSLGSTIYHSEKFSFNIQLVEISGTTVPGLHTFKRVKDPTNLSESTSKYYIQKHKIFKIHKDFIVDKCGFESSIFEDQAKLEFENPNGEKEVYKEKERGENLLFHLKDPVERLKFNNSFDVPVNEVYVTIVNRNAMGFFTKPKVGWTFNFHDTYVDLHFKGNANVEPAFTSVPFHNSGHTFNLGGELKVGDTLLGSIVEYNKYDLQERVVSDAFHKISFDKNIFDYKQDNGNVYGNAAADNHFGYFYQPHYKITLKEYSSYIEESTTKEIDNFPKNAIYFIKDGVWKWRDLYDHGFVDDLAKGVDYPFINGNHYVRFNIRFYVRSEYHYQQKQQIITPFLNRRYRNEC